MESRVAIRVSLTVESHDISIKDLAIDIVSQ